MGVPFKPKIKRFLIKNGVFFHGHESDKTLLEFIRTAFTSLEDFNRVKYVRYECCHLGCYVKDYIENMRDEYFIEYDIACERLKDFIAGKTKTDSCLCWK